MTSIRHITLNSGYIRESFPDEVSTEVIAVLQPVLAQACAGRAIPIPAVEDYSMIARCSGRCMTASIYANGPPSELLCAIAVARHARCGALLWRRLHSLDAVRLATDPDLMPPEPWSGVLLTAAIVGYPDTVTWIDEFERHLAWTFFGTGK